MTTNIASSSAAVNPWQLQVLTGNNTLEVVTKKEAAASVSANDPVADDLFTGRQHPYFLPHFLPPPDGMEWS